MFDNAFFYLFSKMLFRNKKRYIATVIISTLIIALLSSVLFLANSIESTVKSQLDLEPDIVVQKEVGGRIVPIDETVALRVAKIYGVSEVTKRIYGRYFFDKTYSALLFGVDFLDEQSNKALSNLLNKEELRRFVTSNCMVVGQNVAKYLKEHFYNKGYNFLTPDGKIKEVKILKVLDAKSSLFSSNLIIVSKPLAQEILGLQKSEVSDIALNILNEAEEPNIIAKLQALFMGVVVSSKEELNSAYDNLFNYKGGLFLGLYLIVIVTLALLLYQRYSLANSIEKKEVAIFRALGWSIKDILWLKALESISLVLFSFIIGVAIAYIYVFILNAPVLSNLFIGKNLYTQIEFMPAINFLHLATIFILFGVTYLAAVLIPVWKIAITEPKEALS